MRKNIPTQRVHVYMILLSCSLKLKRLCKYLCYHEIGAAFSNQCLLKATFSSGEEHLH